MYRLLAGTHGMSGDDGRRRIVRAGATLSLDAWAAASFGDRVELVVEEEQKRAKHRAEPLEEQERTAPAEQQQAAALDGTA